MDRSAVMLCLAGAMFLVVDLLFVIIPAIIIRRELASRNACINKAFKHYEGQLKVVSQHALEYMNSISIDAQHNLRSAQALFTAMKAIRHQIALKTSTGRHHEALLLARATLQLASCNYPQETLPRQVREIAGWHINMKDYINKVGQDVNRASVEARRIGLKTNRTTDTSQSLTDLGLTLDEN